MTTVAPTAPAPQQNQAPAQQAPAQPQTPDMSTLSDEQLANVLNELAWHKARIEQIEAAMRSSRPAVRQVPGWEVKVTGGSVRLDTKAFQEAFPADAYPDFYVPVPKLQTRQVPAELRAQFSKGTAPALFIKRVD